MEHGPFIGGSPIKTGDFPWLCYNIILDALTLYFLKIISLFKIFKGMPLPHMTFSGKLGYVGVPSARPMAAFWAWETWATTTARPC